MNEQQQSFLRIAAQLPARLNTEQTASLLNSQPHDIPLLVQAKLLKPLGNPPRGGQKFFATTYVLALMKDQSWLARMTNTIHGGWRVKNEKRRKKSTSMGPSVQKNLPHID